MIRGLPTSALVLASLTLVAACGPADRLPEEAPTTGDEAPRDARQETPQREALPGGVESMVLFGLEGLPDSVRLVDGAWRDTTTRTSVVLAPGFFLLGDLDGAAPDEVLLLAETNFGGTGHFQYLVVAHAEAGSQHSVAAHPLGDRVQLRSGALEGEIAVLELVEHGQGDPACCPRLLTTRRFTFQGGALTEVDRVEQGPRTLEALAGTEWVLAAWNRDEPVDSGLPEITLRYGNGGISGSAGCNQYQGSLTEEGDDVSVSPLTVTLRICPDPADAQEARFLQRMGTLSGYSFLAGRLLLAGGDDGDFGWMAFRRR